MENGEQEVILDVMESMYHCVDAVDTVINNCNLDPELVPREGILYLIKNELNKNIEILQGVTNVNNF